MSRNYMLKYSNLCFQRSKRRKSCLHIAIERNAMLIENLRHQECVTGKEGIAECNSYLFCAVSRQGHDLSWNVIYFLLVPLQDGICQARLCQQEFVLQLAWRLCAAEKIERFQDRA